MLRCLKNINGTIVCMANDQNQSGPDAHMDGEWCNWTLAENAVPVFEPIEGLEKALYFKENEAGDGIELRTQEEIELSPNE